MCDGGDWDDDNTIVYINKNLILLSETINTIECRLGDITYKECALYKDCIDYFEKAQKGLDIFKRSLDYIGKRYFKEDKQDGRK